MAGRLDPNAALIACNRFGLGARPGDIATATTDPRGFLKAELRKPDIALILPDEIPNVELKGATPALQASFAAQYQRKLARGKQAATAQRAPDRASASVMLTADPAKIEARLDRRAGQGMEQPATASQRAPKRAEPPIELELFRAEAQARFEKAASAEAGLVERLVHFWSNHFCVSIAKGKIDRVAAGPFEREAIRPFVLGRFVDMLMAVERHPAMLAYLDNWQSIGPDSRVGQSRKRGLNENLAREILELHTLGVDAGYGQADVTAFARMLTGWTFVGREGRLGEPGSFVFNANAHEPGDQALLGKTYPAGGMGQGEAVLNDIAQHPATARHIAYKLARHFIADDPPTTIVERLAKLFRDTDGDLRALAVALVDAPEAWDTPLSKLRSPQDYLAAARRALHPGPVPDPVPMLGGLSVLGQPLWQPPGPNGFPDTSAAWVSAEAMKLRLDIAAQIASRLKEIGNPSDLLNAVIGPASSFETRQAIGRAETKQQGVALLLMSPEFQRR